MAASSVERDKGLSNFGIHQCLDIKGNEGPFIFYEVGWGRGGLVGLGGRSHNFKGRAIPKKWGESWGGGHIKYFRGYKDGMSDGLLFK